MARRRGSFSDKGGGASGAAYYVKLEQQLVLLAWLNRHFGYEYNRFLVRSEQYDYMKKIFTDQLTDACT